MYHMGMGKLTKKDVLKTAKLADLKISKEEVDTFRDQLSKVIDYFDELKEVPTDNVEPTSQTTGLVDVLRDDVIKSSDVLPVEDAVAMTNKVHNNYFLVPAVIDKDNL